VLDLGSRRWLGYSMAGHMRTELVSDALNMAVSTRGGHVKGTIFHGDRGSQYMSGDYRKLVVGHKMRQSVGRSGVCWDNAVAESAWSSLKRELVHRYRFATRAEARRAIFAWINRYNSRRRHSTLGYTAPIAWEQNYNPTKATPAA
jgi:putative transposase